MKYSFERKGFLFIPTGIVCFCGAPIRTCVHTADFGPSSLEPYLAANLRILERLRAIEAEATKNAVEWDARMKRGEFAPSVSDERIM